MELDKPVKHYDLRPIKFSSIFGCPTFKRKEWLECALCSSKIIYLMVLYHERKTCSKKKWHIFCKTSHVNLKRFQKRLSKGWFTLLKSWFRVYHIWLGTGISCIGMLHLISPEVYKIWYWALSLSASSFACMKILHA